MLGRQLQNMSNQNLSTDTDMGKLEGVGTRCTVECERFVK